MTMSVRDTGIGFEPRVLPELFTMFSQVDTAIDREFTIRLAAVGAGRCCMSIRRIFIGVTRCSTGPSIDRCSRPPGTGL